MGSLRAAAGLQRVGKLASCFFLAMELYILSSSSSHKMTVFDHHLLVGFDEQSQPLLKCTMMMVSQTGSTYGSDWLYPTPKQQTSCNSMLLHDAYTQLACPAVVGSGVVYVCATVQLALGGAGNCTDGGCAKADPQRISPGHSPLTAFCCGSVYTYGERKGHARGN